MLKKILLLALLPAIAFAEELPAPVKAIEKQGITIIKTFDAPGGMKGYLGKYQDMGVTIYLTPDGKHAISGYMYNEKGENLYLSSGRILYKLNDSANQLFELTSYPARATERDGQVRQAGEEAYIAELDDLSRDEAEQTALKLMESLIQSEICRAEVVSLYGYTGKQLKRIHQTLYRERNVWRYFYRELPSEVENGLYYVEMRLNIGGVPVCTEGDARGIHGSVDSSDSIIPVKACLVLSKEGLVFLDFAYAFDLSDIRKADALPESAVQAIAREDLKNNPYASDSEEFEMRLMNLCIRHGTGTKASYELCPVWRVQTAGKGDIDFCLAVYDAVSGKRLFEGLL